MIFKEHASCAAPATAVDGDFHYSEIDRVTFQKRVNSRLESVDFSTN